MINKITIRFNEIKNKNKIKTKETKKRVKKLKKE